MTTQLAPTGPLEVGRIHPDQLADLGHVLSLAEANGRTWQLANEIPELDPDAVYGLTAEGAIALGYELDASQRNKHLIAYSVHLGRYVWLRRGVEWGGR